MFSSLPSVLILYLHTTQILCLEVLLLSKLSLQDLAMHSSLLLRILSIAALLFIGSNSMPQYA